eukprot:5232325-Ditylum_brightwellii.AAC.1
MREQHESLELSSTPRESQISKPREPTSSQPREQPSGVPREQLSSKQKPLEQEQIKMIWTNKGDTSKTHFTQAIEEMPVTIKQLGCNNNEMPSTKVRHKHDKMPSRSLKPKEQHAKQRKMLHKEPQKLERKRDQRRINKPPVVPISHPPPQHKDASL